MYNLYDSSQSIYFLFSQYPLDTLERLLCFESMDSVSTFCRHYGLDVQGDHLLLNPAGCVLPEVAFSSTRSYSFIETKQGGRSIGEVWHYLMS